MTHIEKIRAIVDHLGGLHDAAVALGVPYPTVQSWTRRGVASRRVFEVAEKAAKLGYAVDPRDLLEGKGK